MDVECRKRIADEIRAGFELLWIVWRRSKGPQAKAR